MPQITLNYQAQDTATIVAALSEVVGWEADLPDGSPNPETKAQAAIRGARTLIREQVRRYQEQQALLATSATPEIT